MNERELIARARRGDSQAFEELLLPHQSHLYGLCLRMLGNGEDALDAVQETMIRAYTRLGSFRQQAKFSTWLYRVGSNVCLDMLRSRKRRNASSMEELTEAGVILPDEGAEGPEERSLRLEQRRVVLRALQQLAPRYRLILILREVQGFSYEEIAAITHCALGTVKSQLFRARKELQAHLKQSELFAGYGVKTEERSVGRI